MVTVLENRVNVFTLIHNLYFKTNTAISITNHSIVTFFYTRSSGTIVIKHFHLPYK